MTIQLTNELVAQYNRPTPVANMPTMILANTEAAEDGRHTSMITADLYRINDPAVSGRADEFNSSQNLGEGVLSRMMETLRKLGGCWCCFPICRDKHDDERMGGDSMA